MYERFEQILQEKGLTPYRVSIETGVSQGSLSDWKHGRSKPKYTNMIKIADFLDVNPEYLNGTSDTKEKPATNTGDGLSEFEREVLRLMRQLPPNKQDEFESWLTFQVSNQGQRSDDQE